MSNKTEQYIANENKTSAHNYHPIPVVLTKGEGVWVYDVDNNKYLDMLSAYSALNQGHRHPKIINAANEQMNLLTLTSRAFHNNKMVEFLNYLTSVTGFDKALLMNSGAEAVETAVKAARRWGYRAKKVNKNKAEIIVCSDNFHGRTTTIVGFSNDDLSRKGYGPFPQGFKNIIYNDPKALEKAITEDTVAFLVEPIQGEAGVIIPNKGYLAACKKICQENNVLLICDEIQTGLGRTGALFCYEHDKIKPDILIVGKALGGGVYPVSGILANNSVMNIAFEPGSHGSTFGGNPLACAVAKASLTVILEEKLADKSKELGAYFLHELSLIESDLIDHVRGKGLMIAIELTPKAGKARQYTESLMRKGVLAKETHETIIRFAPPLTITKEELNWALIVIKEVFK
jgi:ornithine--oxo-acid transaminase